MWTALAAHVVDSKGVEVGRVPFTVKTGILTSHRSGGMRQEVRVDFGAFTGKVGTSTFRYQPTYLGYGPDAYSIEQEPPTGR